MAKQSLGRKELTFITTLYSIAPSPAPSSPLLLLAPCDWLLSQSSLIAKLTALCQCLNRNDVAGLVHFSQNLECEQAQFISTFPSSDPGTSTVSTALFDLPMPALRATLGLDNEAIQVIVDKVKSVQQRNPSFDRECLARCNIPEPELSS